MTAVDALHQVTEGLWPIRCYQQRRHFLSADATDREYELPADMISSSSDWKPSKRQFLAPLAVTRGGLHENGNFFYRMTLACSTRI